MKVLMLPLLIVLLLQIGLVSAVDFTPQGDINLRNTYYITNNPSTSCPSGELVQGINVNGSWNCSSAGTGDINAVLTPGSYLSGGAASGSVTLAFNETLMNITIDTRTTNNTYINGTGLNLVGTTFSIILTYFQGLFIELTDSFGGEVTGTYDAIVLDHNALDDQYIELGDSFSGDVSGVYSSTSVDNTKCTGTNEYLDGTGTCDTGYLDADGTDATDDSVSSGELDNICNTNERILRRGGGSWACFDDSGYYDDTTLSQEAVEDYVGGMTAGTETRISVTYADPAGNLNYVVDDMNDDDPEANEVHWTDLTDQGSFTDTKYCTYASGTGYISCTSEGGAGTTYTNGTGLDLNSSDYFNILPAYRMPQGCNGGEIAEYNTGTGAWDCGIDNTAASGMASWSLASSDTAGFESITDGETVTFSDDDKYLTATRSTNTLTYSIVSSYLNNTIDDRDTDTHLSEEQVEDFVGGMLGGTETHIAVTYQDATGDIDFVVSDDWYDSVGDIPTATPNNGDTTHLSTADHIWDWVKGLGYITENTNVTFENVSADQYHIDSFTNGSILYIDHDGNIAQMNSALFFEPDGVEGKLAVGSTAMMNNVFQAVKDEGNTNINTFKALVAARNKNVANGTYTGYTMQTIDTADHVVSGVRIITNFTSHEDGSVSGDLLIDTRHEGTRNVRVKLSSDGDLSIIGLTNCDTIDTDANGMLVCGTDADTIYTENSPYLTLDGTIFNLSESYLNNTIDDRDTDTQDLSYDTGTDVISLVDGGSIDITEVDTDTHLTEDQTEAYIFDNDNTADLNMSYYNITTVDCIKFSNGASWCGA